MTKVIKIPMEVLGHDEVEELRRIVAEAHYNSNKVVDELLTDQQRKLETFESGKP